jgi:hypothetical protein
MNRRESLLTVGSAAASANPLSPSYGDIHSRCHGWRFAPAYLLRIGMLK